MPNEDVRLLYQEWMCGGFRVPIPSSTSTLLAMYSSFLIKSAQKTVTQMCLNKKNAGPLTASATAEAGEQLPAISQGVWGDLHFQYYCFFSVALFRDLPAERP